MSAALRILLYLAGTLALGCLLAPPLYWAGQSIGASLSFEALTEPSFQRYYHRAVLVAAVALLWPLYRSLDLRSWDPLGLRPDPRRWRHLLLGFLAAFLLLFAMGWLATAFGLYRPQSEIRYDKIAKGLLAAAAVSPLEEWFFRCAILGAVLRTAPAPAAVLFTSALFSSIHFLKPLEIDVAPVEWWSGFALIPYSFHRFAEPLELLGGFTTLFAIGVVLATVTLRTRALWAAIGLHAGWIFGNRLFNILHKRQGDMQPWFGEKIESGIVPLLTVCLTGIAIHLLLRPGAPPQEASPR
jgi:membrane protease YdiL (CAAX protease family)